MKQKRIQHKTGLRKALATSNKEWFIVIYKNGEWETCEDYQDEWLDNQSTRTINMISDMPKGKELTVWFKSIDEWLNEETFDESATSDECPTQEITSKDTSVNKLAGFYKKALKADIIGHHELVLDYGCGKNHHCIVEFANENNFIVCGYDPYHFPNEYFFQYNYMKHFDLITCNNVLNVLTDVPLDRMLKRLSRLSKIHNIPVYFTVYEGDKTGHGKITKKDCYQRNEKRLLYVSRLKNYFKSVSISDDIIKAY